jgi:hypothetical protein
MSLEQQIADAAAALGGATAAANTLTGTVNAKIGQIDAAVVMATQAIDDKWLVERQSVLAATQSVTVYLDADAGDDANDGLTSAQPVQTFVRLAAVLSGLYPNELYVVVRSTSPLAISTQLALSAAHKAELVITEALAGIVFPAVPQPSGMTAYNWVTLNAPAASIVGTGPLDATRIPITVQPAVAIPVGADGWVWNAWRSAVRAGPDWRAQHCTFNIIGCDVSVGDNGVFIGTVAGANDHHPYAPLMVLRSFNASFTLGAGASKSVIWTDVDE